MYMLLRERDLHNDNYYKCLCGTHVRTGAFIVAIIGVVFGLIQLLSASTPCLNSGIVKYNILCGFFTIFVNSLIIYADQKEKPWAYLPYIIFKGLVIIFYAFVVIVLLIIGIFAPSDAPTIFSGKTPEEKIMAVRIVLISGSIVLLIFNAFLLWFVSIVFRAYQYMREAVNQGILGNQQETDDRSPLIHCDDFATCTNCIYCVLTLLLCQNQRIFECGLQEFIAQQKMNKNVKGNNGKFVDPEKSDWRLPYPLHYDGPSFLLKQTIALERNV